MGKALKPLIIVVFVLSIGALVLGIMLYGKREVMKGRIVKLESSTQEVARNIKYTGLNATQLMDYEAMDSQLRPLTVAAKNTYEEMITTSNNLVSTEGTLKQTKSTLERTETDLQVSQEKATGLEDTVTQKEAQVAQKTRQIGDLESERDELSTQIDGLKNEVSVAQAELADAVAAAASWKKAFDDEVRIGQNIGTGDGGPGQDIDFSGRVLLADTEWNFVVIDGGKESKLVDNAILLIHRASNPVGKIRIRRVEERVAIGEIVKKWQGQNVVAGDEVISPKGAASAAI